MTDNELIRFAEEYIADVNNVCQTMLEVYELGSREELIIKHRAAQGKGEFYFNGKINNYTFHGRGCRFSNDELKLDWDFGCENNWCGLDPWKLFYYLSDNKAVSDLKDGYKIKEMFEEWIANGKMIKKYGLYYFT